MEVPAVTCGEAHRSIEAGEAREQRTGAGLMRAVAEVDGSAMRAEECVSLVEQQQDARVLGGIEQTLDVQLASCAYGDSSRVNRRVAPGRLNGEP
jgi:hypothetical protein